MANNSPDDAAFRRHLDTSGDREVVFCHQCDRQWYRSEYGMPCPGCGGEFTEIVSAESDPRPAPRPTPSPRIQRPPSPPGFTALRHHNPWGSNGDSDPEEEDIEEHVTHSGNSVIFTQTIRHPPRRPGGRLRGDSPGNPSNQGVAGDFQDMIGNILGPEFRAGMAGRSSENDLFSQPRVNNGIQFTFTTGTGPRIRHTPPGGQDELDVAALLGGLFGQMNPNPAQGGNPPEGMPAGMPAGLQGFFAQMLNPANARAGDAVYTQEAFDAIITSMMNVAQPSNAPGPAAADSIASLPKVKLDEKMLGPEGKGECSVCMDEVVTGNEVVQLPCSHWFHETCAQLWLQQHNTCPICRKGIGGEAPPAQNQNSGVPQSQSQAARLNSINRSRDLNARLGNYTAGQGSAETREARLQSIRDLGQRSFDTENDMPDMSASRRVGRRESIGSSNRNTVYSINTTSRGLDSSFSRIRRSESEREIRPRSERPRDVRHDSATMRPSPRRARNSDSQSASRRNSERGSEASGSGSSTNAGSGGPISWLRDRFGGGSSSRRNF